MCSSRCDEWKRLYGFFGKKHRSRLRQRLGKATSMEAESRNQKTAVLEKIRRALGRLSVQTKIRNVEIGKLVAPPSVWSRSVHAGNRPIAGAQEGSLNSPSVV